MMGVVCCLCGDRLAASAAQLVYRDPQGALHPPSIEPPMTWTQDWICGGCWLFQGFAAQAWPHTADRKVASPPNASIDTRSAVLGSGCPPCSGTRGKD